MQQRGATVNYSANARGGFLFPTFVYIGNERRGGRGKGTREGERGKREEKKGKK